MRITLIPKIEKAALQTQRGSHSIKQNPTS
jgi:hypothetical protein